VYMINEQLCRASDECYPPLQLQVEFQQQKVLNVEFKCEKDKILASCRGMSGDVLAEVSLERNETLRGLHKKVLQGLYEQQPDTPAGLSVTIMDAASGQLLSPPPRSTEPDVKLLDLL
ncbi:unnamed protein product, partial [Symbiodinium pilosum]